MSVLRLGLKLRNVGSNLISSFYKRWKWLDRGVRQISDAANVLLKAEEFRRMIPESETKCNRTSPLCNRYRTEKQNIEQTKG